MKWTKLVAVVRDLRVLLFFVLGSLSLQVGFASGASTTIYLEGDWPSKKRELSSAPITASTIGNVLCITDSSPVCNITITIINKNGKIVYEQEVPAVDTANICIPVGGLPASEYTLELTNLSGNYLRGNFTLYQ